MRIYVYHSRPRQGTFHTLCLSWKLSTLPAFAASHTDRISQPVHFSSIHLRSLALVLRSAKITSRRFPS